MKKEQAKKDKTGPMAKKEEVQQHPDNKIDQDFPGFPHSPSQEKMIRPKTKQEEKNADVREAESDGSANAFESTEDAEILRDELNDDKPKKGKNSY